MRRTRWGQGFTIRRITRLTLFLTFGVIALQQARLPNLYVECFVLLILLVVNYFHLDGFAEEKDGEEGGGGRRGKKEERRREGRKVRKGQAGNWKTKRKQKRAVLDFPTDTRPVIRLHNIFTWTDLKVVLLLLKLWKVCIFPLDVRLIFIIMLLEQLTSVWNDQTDILFTLPA